ncbi:hypothetical protein L3X38_029159 [Prunus dulcis]|uniref:Uncharacterized protein n=1 Tax=Prunus dulcis TaxID=3755 RepID=A0AAD4VTV9_PRUDU|nr:hypothetical protein L3X38_029159 [Prunus dulcis]
MLLIPNEYECQGGGGKNSRLLTKTNHRKALYSIGSGLKRGLVALATHKTQIRMKRMKEVPGLACYSTNQHSGPGKIHYRHGNKAESFESFRPKQKPRGSLGLYVTRARKNRIQDRLYNAGMKMDLG